jgi:hypothetical protein
LGTRFRRTLPKTGVATFLALGTLLLTAAFALWRALSRAGVRHLDPGIRRTLR